MFNWPELRQQGDLPRDVTFATPPLGQGSPEAIARAFGARLQRDFPRDWARLLGLAVQAAMEQEHGEGG